MQTDTSIMVFTSMNRVTSIQTNSIRTYSFLADLSRITVLESITLYGTSTNLTTTVANHSAALTSTTYTYHPLGVLLAASQSSVDTHVQQQVTTATPTTSLLC